MRLCAAGFTSSQRNPRYCDSVVGRSILTSKFRISLEPSAEREDQLASKEIVRAQDQAAGWIATQGHSERVRYHLVHSNVADAAGAHES